MAKIEACLKCGSTKVEVVEWYCGDSSTPYYRCQCENGDAWDNWLDTEEKAILYWNKRPN